MKVDKSQIVELLRSQGDEGKAQQADSDLPDQVDTDEHGSLLSTLGMDPGDLVAKLAGGGGSGIGGMLSGH